jgi:hypothetical protein
VYQYGDDYVIVLNEDGLPKLQLSPFYMEELKGKRDKSNDYLQDKLRSAQWLMKSLYQRQRTLFKVAESIVRFQREFFERGVRGLQPLILRDVAEDISMHESTVSRITTNKYMATPHGVYELKFFFNSALEGEDGNQIGSESVKAAIKRIVSGENVKRPLSDETDRQHAQRRAAGLHRPQDRGQIPFGPGHPFVVQTQTDLLIHTAKTPVKEGEQMQIQFNFKSFDPSDHLKKYARTGSPSSSATSTIRKARSCRSTSRSRSSGTWPR